MKRVLVVLALLLAACGDPGPAQATRGNLTLQAAPARLAAGGNVQLALTVRGPVDFEAGCAHTVEFWAVDSSGRQVWAEPLPELDCLAILKMHLEAGQSASFTDIWPTASLAPGRYAIHGLFRFWLPRGAGARVSENLPLVEVQITG